MAPRYVVIRFTVIIESSSEVSSRSERRKGVVYLHSVRHYLSVVVQISYLIGFGVNERAEGGCCLQTCASDQENRGLPLRPWRINGSARRFR